MPIKSMHDTAFSAFNTVVTIKLWADCESDVQAEAVCSSAFVEIERRCQHFEHLFSRTLPDSNLTRLNNAAGAPV